MSTVESILKSIGRALRRGISAIVRFFRYIIRKLRRNIKQSKIERKIARKERSIEELYMEIGRNYYEAHYDQPEELLADLCGAVSEDAAAIREYREMSAAVEAAYREANAADAERARAQREADRAAGQAEKEVLWTPAEEKAEAAEMDEPKEKYPEE